MNKQIQLFTVVFELGLRGTTHQIQPFYKTIKRICENLVDNSVDGNIRVTCESSCDLATKNWQMKLICPPLPKNHPLHYKMQGFVETLSYNKYVYSWGCMEKQTVFKL
jgi:hypothetical protein